LACIIGAFTAQDGIAFGETRTLSFLHTHTNETATITFRRNGQYDQQALNELNWLLRDWRVNEPAKMDPRLFDIVWEVHREAGSRGPVHIVSAYRSPATNKMLRNRSQGVSEHSQHMSGRAMDIRLPDVDTARLRAVAMRLQYGGVGYYASSGFVHLDVGSVRAWPRMSQEQLAQLFPNGKTLHLPAEGKPLPGYDEAKSEILARNSALALQASANTGTPVVSSWLSKLFRSGESEYSPQGRLALAAANVALSDAEQGYTPFPKPMPPLPPPRPSELMQLNDDILAGPPPSPDIRPDQPVDGVAYEPDLAVLLHQCLWSNFT
jgi:uncharacterized protein YcbK (DUF882 family)